MLQLSLVISWPTYQCFLWITHDVSLQLCTSFRYWGEKKKKKNLSHMRLINHLWAARDKKPAFRSDAKLTKNLNTAQILWPNDKARGNFSGSPKLSQFIMSGGRDVCSQFYGNLFNSWWYNSFWMLLVATKKKNNNTEFNMYSMNTHTHTFTLNRRKTDRLCIFSFSVSRWVVMNNFSAGNRTDFPLR